MLVLPAGGEEMVSIPKARLLELERKEKELDAIKGITNKGQEEKVQLEKAQAAAKAEQQALEQKQKELEAMKRTLDQAEKEKAQLEAEKARLQKEAAQSQKAQLAAEAKAAEAKAAEAKAAAAAAKSEPVIAHDTPPLASLPPLQKGQVVDAMDLMNHYRADPIGAAKCYEGQRIRVQGVITGFSKPPFIRPYEILLQTTEKSWKVICHVEPPDQFSAAFTTKHGEELVGSNSSGARMTLARVGQKATVEATCKGLKDQEIKLTACRLVAVEP